MSKAIHKRRVFISHSGEDTWVARQIAKEIAERDGEPCLDEADVSVGAEFEEDILQFLDTADELLVLMTPWAYERPYVWSEIGAAWFKRIPIIILLHGWSIQEFQSRPSVPVFLKKRDMIKLNDIDKYLTQFQGHP
ncbi:MAG: toll/interleukin-1 receptor domain-containing protein [Anaerolineae bacterium]|nr:toll/interleukin-1 receptor domain-containing protein [Anaerolineae bacterium]